MDVMEQFESGDRALAAVRELILSEGGETVWARERERVTALFSDEGLRPRAPGMLRGDRQLTHVVRVGPSRHLTVSLSLKGEDPASRLSYKDEIGSYEFEQSSEPTSAVSRLTEKRGTVLGGAQVGFSHSTVNNTFSVTGSWEQQRSVTTQRADRQISGSQTTESATRFEGSVRAELSRRIGTGPARDVDEIDFRTRVAVPTRDVLDRDPTPANPASAETPGPLTGDVRLQTPPHVAERYALSASDVVTDLRLTADGTHGGTTSVRALLDGASMRDAFDTAYGRRARDAREEIAGLLTVESLQAHLHGMTNKQPLVLHLRSVPGGRVEVHASIERLDTESAPPAGARRGEPSMRITGDTGKTEFHHGTETDTSRNVQNQVTWAGGVQNRLRMPGSAEQAVAGGGADNAHSMSQADDQGDVRQFRQRSTLKTQAKGRALEGQARLRFELHPPAGSGHGSGRRTGAAQGTDRTPAAIPEENRGPVASPVTRPPAAPPTPTDTRQAFRGVVRETRARFGLLMEQSQADPAPSAGFMGQTVWAPPQRLWRLEAAPVRTNSTTRQYWWHPGRPPAASPEGAGQVGGAQRQEVPRGTDTSAPLRGLGSLDRVTNLDLSGFHGMLEVMGRQAFGGRWNTSRDEVTDWFHLSRVRASLPGMTRHTPLTWTGRSGHATSASFTADFHELTFRRTIKTLSSPSAETTRGVTTTRSDAAQHGAQLALGGRGGDIAGGNVLGEVIAGSTRVTRDGDRQRELERTVVATKFDVEMAVFDGWVRLDGTLSGPRGTVRDSGLFPVQIAVPFGDLLGSRVHDSPEAPVFTAERPSGFVPQARRKMLALAEAHAAARAATAPAGTAKADKLSPPPQRAPERDLNIAPEAQSSGAGAKADLGPKAVTGPSNRHATDPFVPKDAPSSARHVPEPPPLDWTPPAQRENPPPPPAHALAHAWHPADMLLGVDPADGLLSAIRQDLAPVLGRSLDREMRGVEEQFGADVLTARLTHESGQEWSHDISVTGGHITVRVRPVREATYEYVGHSKDFETDLSVESQSSRAHLRNEVPRVVVGGRVQVPVAPNVSLAVQVTHSTSATPGRGGEWPSREGRNHAPQQSGTHPAAARDGGDGLAGTGQAGELAGERDDRTPLRIKNLQPHNLYRQPIRFEISYEKHLGARLLSGVPAAPLPVRLNGVFSYPSAPPAVSGRTPAGPAALPDGLGADHVVLTLRPHAPASGGVLPGPANQDATRRAPTDQPPAPDQGRGSRRTPDEDLVAAHVLDGVDESGSGLFGKDWERVRAELTPHVRTMALQEQLGTLSRGRSETVRLTSVDGASVELRLRVESLTETKAPGSTEFYDGRQSALSSSDAHTRSSAWQAYVQVQSDLLPSGAPVNGSVLGRLEGGWGKEGLDGRGNSGMSGLLLRRKVAATAHVGLASIEVRMTRPGASGQRDRSVTYAGSRLEFTTVRAPKDAADAPLLPRPGILPDRTADGGGRALMDGRGEPVPARGLSRDTVVRSIARGDDVRSQVSAHLRDTLGSKRAALIQESVEQALDDTRLAGGLTAMTRGEEVELYRSGDLRVTAEAHVQDMVFRHLESKGATANVLNEVNQSRVRRSGTFREAGGRFLAGPVFKAASLKAGLLVGGGGNGRWRTAIGNTQNSKVSAYAKFARPYAAFDGRMQVTVKVTQDSRTSTLRPVDVEGQILLPVSETQPAPLAPPTLSPPPAPREEAHTEVSEVPEPAPSQGEGTRRTRRADTSPSGAPEPERPEQARRQAGPAQFSAPDDAAQTTSADHPARTEAADVDTRTRPAAGKPTDEPATRNTGADPRETAERATTTKQSKTPQPDPRGIPDPRHRPTVQAAMEPATGPATGPPQERPGHPPREEPRTSPHPAPSTPAEIPEPTRTTDLGRFDITEGPVELSPRQVVHLHQMAVTVAQHAVANTVQGVPLPRVVVVGESDGTRGGLTHFGQGVRNGGDLAHTLAQQFRGILQERLNILQTGRVRAVTADNIEISAVSRTLGPPDGIVGSPRRSAHFSMHLPRLTRQAATAGEHASGARGGQSSPAHSRGPEPSLRPGPPREPETSPAPESSMSRSTAPSRQPAGTATSTPQAAEQSEQHTTDTTGSQQEATPRAPAEPRPQRRASAGQGTGAQGSYPPSGSRPLGAGVERHPERHRDLPSPSEPVEQVTPAPVAPGGGAAPGASPAPQRRGTSPDSTGAGASHDPAGPGPRPVQSPDPKSPDGRR
ncbi:hypothetical protein ACIQB4_29820 [Streptomyces griseoluteus]|uniref:hypothetical protein n=1 Tax=Streptomyces griseoluteus TaxID=29306 RepID=UPI003809E459